VTNSTTAIDTNILVYAVSSDEPEKAAVVEALLTSFAVDSTVLLWQVACELNAVLTRLVARGRAQPDVLQLAELVCTRFALVMPTPAVLGRGLRIHRERQVSFWDAMLIAACVEAGVTTLYTEDSQSAGVIESVRLVNPFQR